MEADALSQQFDHFPINTTTEPVLTSTIIVAPVQWDIITEIMEAQINEPVPPEYPPNRTYVPLNFHHRVIQWGHNSPNAGHPGINATIQLVINCF